MRRSNSWSRRRSDERLSKLTDHGGRTRRRPCLAKSCIDVGPFEARTGAEGLSAREVFHASSCDFRTSKVCGLAVQYVLALFERRACTLPSNSSLTKPSQAISTGPHCGRPRPGSHLSSSITPRDLFRPKRRPRSRAQPASARTNQATRPDAGQPGRATGPRSPKPRLARSTEGSVRTQRHLEQRAPWHNDHAGEVIAMGGGPVDHMPLSGADAGPKRSARPRLKFRDQSDKIPL
jgi:hypothetical protein